MVADYSDCMHEETNSITEMLRKIQKMIAMIGAADAMSSRVRC